MKRFLLAAVLGVFLTGLVFGEEVFKEEKKRFSFTLQEGWREVPMEELDEGVRYTLENLGGDMETVAVFKRGEGNELEMPFMTLRYQKMDGETESELIQDKLLSLEGGVEMIKSEQTELASMIKAGEHPLVEEWAGSEMTVNYARYVQPRHAVHRNVKLSHGELGELVIAGVSVFGGHRVVVMDFYNSSKDTEDVTETAWNTELTVEFESGYGFGGELSASDAMTRNILWEWGKWLIGAILLFAGASWWVNK